MRPRQTILLGLLLLVPVLAFLFLYGFGRNHYALPTYLPERTDSVRTPAGGWQRDTVFHRVRPFRLQSVGGSEMTSSTLGRGLYVVHFWGADAANTEAMRYLTRVQEKFRREPRVRLATLVPAPAIARANINPPLEQLSEQWGTISGKWFMLGADPDTLARLARYEFGLLNPQPARLPFQPATDLGKLSPGRLVLIDRDQHVRGYYDGTDIHEIERLLTEINVLLYTYDDHH